MHVERSCRQEKVRLRPVGSAAYCMLVPRQRMVVKRRPRRAQRVYRPAMSDALDTAEAAAATRPRVECHARQLVQTGCGSAESGLAMTVSSPTPRQQLQEDPPNSNATSSTARRYSSGSAAACTPFQITQPLPSLSSLWPQTTVTGTNTVCGPLKAVTPLAANARKSSSGIKQPAALLHAANFRWHRSWQLQSATRIH